LQKLVVERCINRLKGGFQIEVKQMVGEQRVSAWVQLGGIAQVLGTLAMVKWKKRDKNLSLSFISG